MDSITNLYYENNAKKLRTMVDKVLYKLRFRDIDYEDFYSLANEVFIGVLRDYDESQDFDGFLYSCLNKKFKTEMTYRTRNKRCLKREIKRIDEDGNLIIEREVIEDIRLDAPIGDSENSTYGDLLADKSDTEGKVFKEDEREKWHIEVKQYLASLSPLQRKIAFLMSDNYTPEEICEELHITMQHYSNSVKRIFADEKIKVLRPLVEKGRM